MNLETLLCVLNKMLNRKIVHTDYQTTQLHGGTLGDVRLVTGLAEAADGGELPYRLVWKTQKKWERFGDAESWRREYDLYRSDLGEIFTDSLQWPAYYHAEMNDDEIQMWMEYIDGVSGSALTTEMLEQAAEALGQLQGRLYQKSGAYQNIACLGDAGFMERERSQWYIQKFSYEFLVSPQCRMSDFLKQMLMDHEIQLYDGKSFEYSCLRSKGCDLPVHLKNMLIDIDDRIESLFANIKSLPIVLCHRDFWIENIFISGSQIGLIDWDTAGWGYLGEDIASLIIDDTASSLIDEYYRRLVPAYQRGLSKYMDISHINNFYIWEMMLIKFGYRIFQNYFFTQSPEVMN